jgi:hypothetical protein
MQTFASASTRELAALVVLLAMAAATPVSGQQPAQQAPQQPSQQTPASSSNQDEANQQLLERVQELEKEVQQLKAQPPAAAPVPPPPPEPAPQMEPPTVNEVAPRLKFTVFGDVGAQSYSHIPDTFLFGSLDLFMTARLSDKVSALGEVLFISESDNSIGLDVERLLLRYRQNEYLSVAAGRYHTWVGYYNSAFNKGEYLETAVDRPFFYGFDDTGGFLPMQDIGITATGKIPSGKLGLNWVFEVGNGRDWGLNVEPAQNNQDVNNSKAINGGLYVRPDYFSGLQAGFSFRHDNLSIPGQSVAETIAVAHVVFSNVKYEILNEGVLVRHVEPTGPIFRTSCFYSQWSRAFGALRPYFRYQYFNAPSNDPVWVYAGPNDYAPLDHTAFVGRLQGPSAGVRYDFTEHSALKLQYDRYDLRGLADVNGLNAQVAFTF